MSERSERIIAEIEAEVLEGKLQPGTRLPSEERLCERFGVSRTVIREAIQQLRGRALLRTTKGSGTYIADPSLDSLTAAMETYAALVVEANFTELIDFRILIETECARLAALNASEKILKNLAGILSSMRKEKTVRLQFSKSDIAFHLAIARSSGNQIYAGILGAQEKRFIDYAQTNRGDHAWHTCVIDSHEEIFEAITAGVPERAAEAMRRHLISSKRHFLDLGIRN